MQRYTSDRLFQLAQLLSSSEATQVIREARLLRSMESAALAKELSSFCGLPSDQSRYGREPVTEIDPFTLPDGRLCLSETLLLDTIVTKGNES